MIIVTYDYTTMFSEIDDNTNSAVIYTLSIKRDPYFLLTYYLVPSVIFVIVSYCSYWIDKNATTARCSLAITTTLITLQFYIGTHFFHIIC
jgi:hypothetical protein